MISFCCPPNSFYLGLQKGRHATSTSGGTGQRPPVPLPSPVDVQSHRPSRHIEKKRQARMVFSQVLNNASSLSTSGGPSSQIFLPLFPVYARQMRLIVSTSPTSVVSNSYSARPMTAVAALRPHTKSLRIPGMRFLGM